MTDNERRSLMGVNDEAYERELWAEAGRRAFWPSMIIKGILVMVFITTLLISRYLQ